VKLTTHLYLVQRLRMSEAEIPVHLPAVMLWTATLNLYLYLQLLSMFIHVPITVVRRSNAWVCGCSLAGTAGSNPALGMDTIY
jgi:hypothetical protein